MSKSVFITGASRGIGLALTHHYLMNGDQVFAAARNPETQSLAALKNEYPGLLTIIALDVADPLSIEKAAAELRGQPIHLLINNAGIFKSKRAELETLDESTWIEEFRVNSISPLMITRALKANLAATSQGIVCMMSSKMGSMGDNNSGGDYSYRSSKAALNAVSVSMARDLAEDGIAVVALHPGWVRTDMGGPNALIDVETSAMGIKSVLDRVGPSESGRFFDFLGNELPW